MQRFAISCTHFHRISMYFSELARHNNCWHFITNTRTKLFSPKVNNIFREFQDIRDNCRKALYCPGIFETFYYTEYAKIHPKKLPFRKNSIPRREVGWIRNSVSLPLLPPLMRTYPPARGTRRSAGRAPHRRRRWPRPRSRPAGSPLAGFWKLWTQRFSVMKIFSDLEDNLILPS